MGTSSRTQTLNVQYQDHPHAYGDKAGSLISVGCGAGSSPRVWGQESLDMTVCGEFRIIPTRMGTSKCRSYTHKVDWDHPHAYGDKKITHFCVDSNTGSSPRVWGQAGLFCVHYQQHRIIPTRMGTSTIGSLDFHRQQDHPHAYGDKNALLIIPKLAVGSSPRVWGQDILTDKGRYNIRIIPTRMGTRSRPKKIYEQ